MSKKLNMELMEIFEGEAIYYHAEDCPSFCDFACNGSQGDLIALSYNEGVKSAQQSVKPDKATCTEKYHAALAEKGDTVCGVCGSPLRR